MSNYTLAGCETFANYVRLQDYLTPEEVANFLTPDCRWYLHSFGQDFKGKYDKHVAHELRTIERCLKLYKDCEIVIDSGGFQISINKIPRRDIPRFQDLFYDEFLLQYYKLITRAFVMDMPPGPGCEVFKNFQDMYEWNLQSYLRAASLPQEIRDIMIYIHHFRTPQLWLLYTKIMREYDLFDKFLFHGTGGLVANQSTDTQTPQILLIFPLVQLLNEAKRCGRNYLEYHVLGNATYRDVLFYHLIEQHVKECHDIDLTISFDSSGLYKGIMRGRHIIIMDDDHRAVKVDLREAKLDNRCQRSISFRDKFVNAIREMCQDTGLRLPPEDMLHEIYYWKEEKKKKPTRTLHPVMRLYIGILYLYNYSKANKQFKPIANDLYQLYKDDHIEQFNMELMQLTRAINFGKITRKQKKKTEGIVSTLNLLRSLDEDHCFHLVNKYLGKDEFDLDATRKVLKI